MALQDVKKTFAELSLSDETRKAVDEIIDASILRGGMTGDERDKLLAILDVEDEITDIEYNGAQDAVKAIEDYQEEVATILEQGVAELEAIEK
jgi:hypothetical protein